MEFRRVTVIGCGLIGASVALALRRGGACGSVLGWDVSSSTLDAALSLGAIDGVDAAWSRGAESESDLIYLAMPVGEIIRFLRERAALVKRRAIITDAGSTKVEVCRAARDYLPEGRRFVGGHPMAGSNLSGPAHASATLFEGAAYVLTDGEGEGRAGALGKVRRVVETMGARVSLMRADDHDRAVAWVSHLPQLLSSVLAATVNGHDEAGALLGLAGGGYNDMTRLAKSPWAVWRDIVATNGAPIADALDAVAAQLDAVREEVRRCAAGGGLGVTGALFEEAHRPAATPASEDTGSEAARARAGRGPSGGAALAAG
ncbi:MAG: prephenate dehydrogenase/arogenate dehydrogenase family protein [Acidobacteria bacterium]|nr:prephenate dehydrogenase/arogenate dehydrogenase family protein [Acidobacteriota bacterium]